MFYHLGMTDEMKQMVTFSCSFCCLFRNFHHFVSWRQSAVLSKELRRRLCWLFKLVLGKRFEGRNCLETCTLQAPPPRAYKATCHYKEFRSPFWETPGAANFLGCNGWTILAAPPRSACVPYRYQYAAFMCWDSFSRASQASEARVVLQYFFFSLKVSLVR